MDDDRIDTVEDGILSGLESSDKNPNNRECLSPDLKNKKAFLLKAYDNPLQGYKIDDNLRMQNPIQNEVKHMDVVIGILKIKKQEVQNSLKRREQMKKRLQFHKYPK